MYGIIISIILTEFDCFKLDRNWIFLIEAKDWAIITNFINAKIDITKQYNKLCGDIDKTVNPLRR